MNSNAHPKRTVAGSPAVRERILCSSCRRVKLRPMCGIVGIIGARASGQTAAAMAATLRHRGPDGEGVFEEPGAALAHRRLSILDLTDGARQPMLQDDFALTYNGELYNHGALRDGLPGPWRSSGDTEVLLRLLVRDGAAALDRLIGMFAFGLWDRRRRRLLLVRDRLGIKPLYYRLLPDGIAFASELKALLVLGTPPIDRSAVRDFLLHGYVPAPKTIFRGIAKLPAGHWLDWEAGGARRGRGWAPRAEPAPHQAQEATESLDALL